MEVNTNKCFSLPLGTLKVPLMVRAGTALLGYHTRLLYHSTAFLDFKYQEDGTQLSAKC